MNPLNAIYLVCGILGFLVLLTGSGWFIRKAVSMSAVPTIDLLQKSINVYKDAVVLEERKSAALAAQLKEHQEHCKAQIQLMKAENEALTATIANEQDRSRRLEEINADWALEKAAWIAERAKLEKRIASLEAQIKPHPARRPPTPPTAP